MRTWTEGWLPDGTHVHVDADPYVAGGVLRLDGEVVEVRRVNRMRDGGTTEIMTARGTLLCFRRMGHMPYDAWEGQRLLTRRPTEGARRDVEVSG